MNTAIDKKLLGSTCVYREDTYAMSKQDIVNPGRCVPLDGGYHVERDRFHCTVAGSTSVLINGTFFMLPLNVIALLPWVQMARAQMAAFFPIMLRFLVKKARNGPIEITRRMTK